jgi:hypothetical protein
MTQTTDSTAPALAAQRFVEAFNARDEKVLRKLYHPDARIKRPTWPSEGDVAASLASIQLDFGAYPDGQLEVRQVVVQDRVAVVEFQFEGKNTQPLTLFNGQEILPTGRPLRLGGTIVLEVEKSLPAPSTAQQPSSVLDLTAIVVQGCRFRPGTPLCKTPVMPPEVAAPICPFQRAFLTPHDFAPDGRGRPAETLVCMAVGR